MKNLRFVTLVVFSLLLVAGATWAGAKAPSNSLLLMRDGHTIFGQVFTINDQSVSMLTNHGILTYKRKDVSELVFLEDWNTLVLKFEGVEVEDGSAEGEMYYAGGAWDGFFAGTWESYEHPVYEGGKALNIAVHLNLERNTLARGTLDILFVFDGNTEPTGVGNYERGEGGGVVLAGTGEWANCTGDIDIVWFEDSEDPEHRFHGILVIHFDAVH